MMDTLISFVHTIEGPDDSKQALTKAKDCVVGTQKMEAELGRSTYLDKNTTPATSHPENYGLCVLVERKACH